MRPAIAYFWLFPLFILLATAAVAVFFFLRYRKTIRHYFLSILAAGLYFCIYLLMVYDTTFATRIVGVSIMESAILLFVEAILVWDVPMSYSYALNRALPRRAGAACGVLAALPLGFLILVLALPAGFETKAETLRRLADLLAALPSLAVLATSALALADLREASLGPRIARIAFSVLGFGFVVLGYLGRYFLFPGSFPQGELSVVTALLAWDLAATALSLGFGPGEAPEGAVVKVPDAFLKEAGITAREAEVLELLATGSSYKDISVTLGVSMPAVKKRLSSVYRKSGAANRIELVNILLEYGRKSPGTDARETR